MTLSGRPITQAFTKPMVDRMSSRFEDLRNMSIVSKRLVVVWSEICSWNSCKMRVSAMMDALIECGEFPAKPAETIVKYSSREAGKFGKSVGMCGTREFTIVPPPCIFSPIVTSKSKAMRRAFSLFSFVEMRTWGRMEGMKCRSLLGSIRTTWAMAESWSRLAAGATFSAQLSNNVCNSSLRASSAALPASDLANRGINL